MKAIKWYILAIVVIALDQITKLVVAARIDHEKVVKVMPYFNLTHRRNEGAAFSFLADAGGWQRWGFSGLAFVVSIGIAIWIFKINGKERVNSLGLSLVLGGAVGNLIDRVAYGWVIDFLDAYWGSYHWPAFNIADIAISVGVFFLLLGGLLEFLKERSSAKND